MYNSPGSQPVLQCTGENPCFCWIHTTYRIFIFKKNNNNNIYLYSMAKFMRAKPCFELFWLKAHEYFDRFVVEV